MQQESEGLNLERTLSVLRGRTPLILLCFVLAAGAAFGVSRHQTKKYTATASLVFSSSQLSQQVAGLQATNNADPQMQQATDVKLVELGDAASTAKLIGRGLTPQAIHNSLSVSAEGNTNIVSVSATAASPTLAADMANTYTSQFVKEQQNNNHQYYSSALAIVNKQLVALSPKQKAGAGGLALQDRAQSLGVLAELRNDNVEIAQAATVPTSPSSPKTSRNTALGAVLGLLLGLSITFLLERFDRRIREPKDLEAIYGLPLLGVIPESAALSRSVRSKKNAKEALPPGESESFHLVRAHLRYFNIDRELRTLLVASAAPGDGKTTIARHLAAAAARMGSRVLLVEADLRRPTLAKQFDIQSGPGLADVLIGALSLNEATQSIDLDSPSVDGSGGRTLDVLVAGAALPPNPGELVESHAMETVLERAKSAYDLIVIDTPPLTAVSDAFPLLRKVDGVIIVGRVGRNRRDVAERLHETLTGAGAPLLGVIANGFKARGNAPYAYAYDYAASGSASASAEAAALVSSNGAVPAEESVPMIKG